MDQETNTLITTRQWFVIDSTVTNHTFIDESRKAYCFEGSLDAESFCKAHADTKVRPRRDYTKDMLLQPMYRDGIDDVIMKRNGAEDKEIHIEKTDMRREHYNRNAAQNLLLLKETSEKQYLTALAKEKFIIPTVAEPRKAKHFSSLRYGAVGLSGGEKCYLLFLTMQEFSKWNDDNMKKFSPLFINFRHLERIRYNRAAIVSPADLKIYLSDDDMKKAVEDSVK